MRVAVLSDIHGNSLALHAVLQDLARHQKIDQTWILGDYFAFGPSPREVWNTITKLDIAEMIIGNTDRYLFTGAYPGHLFKKAEDWDKNCETACRRSASFLWTVEQIGFEAFDFLKSLPAQKQLNIQGFGNVLLSHGSPGDDELAIWPGTSDDELRRRADGYDIQLLLAGHTHVFLDQQVGQMRVITTGSVGLPFDGDQQAGYVILNFENNSCEVEICRLEYDVEATIEQLRNHGPPDFEFWIEKLHSAGV